MEKITLVERKTKKGYAVNIYNGDIFCFVAFSATSFKNARRNAMHLIKNNRVLSTMEIIG